MGVGTVMFLTTDGNRFVKSFVLNVSFVFSHFFEKILKELKNKSCFNIFMRKGWY